MSRSEKIRTIITSSVPGYEEKIPFVLSLLVEFRKRLSEDVLNEINEIIIEYNAQKSYDDSDSNNENNSGTLILDATCAPQNIKNPQDISLLNEVSEKLEAAMNINCFAAMLLRLIKFIFSFFTMEK